MFLLKRASYKKVPFLMEVATTRGGRKDTVHEFPGSNKQSIEDFGLKPRGFSITIIIIDVDYEVNRDRVIDILSEGGNGVLIHPTLGRLENIVARRWTLKESIDKQSRAEIIVQFAINDAPSIPFQKGVSANEVQATNAILGGSVSDNISSNYLVNTNLTGNYESAVAQLEKVGEAFNNLSTFGSNVNDQINIYNSEVVRFTNTINSLVTQPSNLANSIATLFANLNLLFISPADTYGAMVALFGFAGSGVKPRPSTVSRIQRISNENIIDKAINTTALGYAYQGSTQLEFQTNVDIEGVEEQLEEQYANVIDPGLDDLDKENEVKSGLSDDILDDLNDIRVDALQLLDEELLNTKKVVSLRVPLLPISVIAYRLYGNTDLADALVNLNGINQSSFVEGDILVLSE